MLNLLKAENNIAYTENGALTNRSSMSHCVDLFFTAGAMRNQTDEQIENAVIKAYIENPEKTMKIIFFARDVRGGLGERRFFRTAVRALAKEAPEAVKRNISLFAEYGRYDDLCVLLDTPCADETVKEISRILDADLEAMANGESISLLAKWLPSVNASSAKTVAMAKKLCKSLGMTERDYRRTLASLRSYIDIIENRLREYDYTFDYSKQPSKAMFKYRKAFIRNDGERYNKFVRHVISGEEKLHASALFPYEIVRRAFYCGSEAERASLDAAWRSLDSYGNGEENCNSIAVIDGSGSMTCGSDVRPIDAALSLGIYFAEHNKGTFANHFITFSEHPQLVEIQGDDIVSKVSYCSRYNEVANTDLEAVFELILSAAVRNKVPQSKLPSRLYIISDMEFDWCIEGGNNQTLFELMKRKYARFGYTLPDVIFWNVNSRQQNIPVTFSETGAALVSGFSPAIFDMVKGREISPESVMDNIIYSERYAKVS
ncbi:MAG: DUF2828 family protein [Oscillospiraceae bacterium]|nr:DUF2828 family protein [Oscillospiraceae bacterium]